MSSKYNKFKRLLAFILMLAMLIPMIPLEVLASPNLGKGKTQPGYGQGVDTWRMGIVNGKLQNPGLRVSIYWAEDEKAYVNGEAEQLVRRVDIFPDNPRYMPVEEYTYASVYDYMNPKSSLETYVPILNNEYKFYNKKNVKGSNVVETLPDIINGSQEEWHTWLETPNEDGVPTYKNVEALGILAGAKFSADDFKTGIKREIDGSTKKGIYKIYLEPLVSMVVNGRSVVMSLRDMIAWEHDFAKGILNVPKVYNSNGDLYQPSIVTSLAPAFEFLANSHFLLYDEPSIQMSGNDGYRVKYNRTAESRSQIKSQIQKGVKKSGKTESGFDYEVYATGKIYASMGVGVVSSPQTVDLPMVVKSYVTPVDIDENGNFVFEEFKPTEKEYISLSDPRFDKESGILTIEEELDLGHGVGFINDIITSPKDLTKIEPVENISWLEGPPKSTQSQIYLNSQNISRFLFGIITGLEYEVENVVETPSNSSGGDFYYTERNKDSGVDMFRHISDGAGRMFTPNGPSNYNSTQGVTSQNKAPILTYEGLIHEMEMIRMLEQKQIEMIEKSKQQSSSTKPNPPTPSPNTKNEPVYIDPSPTSHIYVTNPDDDFIYFAPEVEFIEVENSDPMGSTDTHAYLRAKVAVQLEDWKEVPVTKESDLVIEYIMDDVSYSIYIDNDMVEEAYDAFKTIIESVVKDREELVAALNEYEKLSREEQVERYGELELKSFELNAMMHQLDSYKYEFEIGSTTRNSIELLLEECHKTMERFNQLTIGIYDEYMESGGDYRGPDDDEDLIELESEGYNNDYTYNPPVVEPETLSSELSLLTDGGYNIAYLRYIVLPKSVQINVIDFKMNGVSTGQHMVIKTDLLQDRVGDDTYSEMVDVKNLGHPTAELKSWFASEGLELEYSNIPKVAPHNKYPNDGSYDMTTLQTIKNLPEIFNIYAFWEVDIQVPQGPSGDVPEWRLSKYEDDFITDGIMTMGLGLRHWGNYRNNLSSPGSYNNAFKTFNPNDLETVKTYSPPNMNLTPVVNAPWYHSKVTEATSDSYISLDSLFGIVNFKANLNRIKSDTLGKYRVANWVASNNPLLNDLSLHGIVSDNKGVKYTGSSQETKVSDFLYKIENKRNYIHNYVDRYARYNADGFAGYSYHYGSYRLRPTYVYYQIDDVTTVFDRYVPVDTSSKMLNNIAPVKKEQNGKTTIAIQENYEINVYPEVAMLFENDKGDRSIAFVSGDMARKIKPITFHSLEHKVFVEATSVGTSIATSHKAKQVAPGAGIGNKQVIHKGAGVNTSFEIKDREGSNTRGYLEVKSYVLDIGNSSLKSAWGNNFNTNNVKNNFLSQWSFTGKGSSRLEVLSPNGSALAYEGPLKVNNITYTKGSESLTRHTLTVRGGVLTHVNDIPISTVKTSNPSLYEALEGMKLVGANKDSTVLATFERQQGKLLEEDIYRTMATSARGYGSDLELNKGWYNEDTTQLVIIEYTTRYNVPNTMYADKLPMSIKGLETPLNKSDFYSKISKGHVFLNYTLESNNIGNLGKVKVFFELTTRTSSPFNKVEVNYGVPNVSISDTSGLF